MSSEKELKELFPTSKEIIIAGKKILVKPMVWTDFIALFDELEKVFTKFSEEEEFDLTKFTEKDFGKLVPVIKEVLSIFARWLKVEVKWLMDNLSAKGTLVLIGEFIEINEWEEVKKLFFQLKLKARKKEEKK